MSGDQREVEKDDEKIGPLLPKDDDWAEMLMPKDDVRVEMLMPKDDVRAEMLMQKAAALAVEALDAGEVPVGCVFVYKNEVIATGRNRVNESRNATRHAEIEAFDELSQYCRQNQLDSTAVLPNTTLYVTVEPCIMCAATLRMLGVRHVVYGCKNDRFGGCGSVLNAHAHEVISDTPELDCTSGILAEQSIKILKNFYECENPNAPEGKRKVGKQQR